MKKKKTLFFFLLIALLVVGLFACSCSGVEEGAVDEGGEEAAEGEEEPAEEEAGEEEVFTIRLVVPSGAGDELTVKDEEMAERFNERVEGFEIKVYPGGSLVNVPEFLDAVRTGAVEMMDAAPPIFAGAEPRFNAVILPYLFETGEALYAAAPELVELYNPIFEEQFNQKLLTLFFVGSFDLFNTKRTVKTPEDLNGLLIGAPDPGIAATVEVLGGTPITVAWPDFYSSLDKGVIDGVLNSPNGTINNSLTDMCKYYTELLVPPGVNVITINLDVWNSMPEDAQQALLEEAQATGNTASEHYIQQHEKDVETLRELGLEITILSEEELQVFKDRCEPFTNEMLESYGEFGEQIKEIADKYR
ncbi:MAG: TRAP transporter substrate-binding protein [Bacillota bacterium]|nr:TRAP transporter substrate-binding protein [Bacillota bacterium]